MLIQQVLPPTSFPPAVVAPFKVDPYRGSRNGEVSRQWSSRPADQRYLKLSDLKAAVDARRFDSDEAWVSTDGIRVVSDRSTPDDLLISYQRSSAAGGAGETKAPTHWAFTQLCSLVKAPASYLRELPGPVAAINLQWGLQNNREDIKLLISKDRGEARAITSVTYGRIWDNDAVDAIVSLVDRTGGRWKVPGVMNWHNRTYNPLVDVAKDTTTLFASDRDIFIFLVDDLNPVEIGKLPDGSPDLAFRGFYVSNSETGAKRFVFAGFWLRGVCCNRNLWGVEDFNEISIVHSSGAPARFSREAVPALNRYGETSAQSLISSVNAVKSLTLAKDDDDRTKVLSDLGFSKKRVDAILDTVIAEDGKPAETAWDFINGITGFARRIDRQDERLEIERLAAGFARKAAKAAA